MLWLVTESHTATWRVIFNALMLLEHLIKNGLERCVDDARKHSHQLCSLNNFNYYEGMANQGIGVREKSKQIVELLADNEWIHEEQEWLRHYKKNLVDGV